MNKKFWVITAGIFGFLGVALGAFGAHSLRNTLSAEMLDIYKTGVNYQLIHSIAILALGLMGNKKFVISLIFFTAGIILFSFSLYIYSITGIIFFAMITPLGGLSFLAGWLMIIIKAIKN
jgi:uncharacterized membrane protein YgdD (TMEM256/DUF423 family)